MNTRSMNGSRSAGTRVRTLLWPCAALALVCGSLALTGCGGEEPANSGGNQPGAGVTTPGSATAPATGGTAPAAPAEADARGTVGGTLELFITAMEGGDFESAIDLVDASTDLHTEILSLIESIETASAINDPNAGNIADFVRRSFALTFAGADYEVASEDEARARAVLTLPGANNAQRPVTLNRVDGQWFLLAGRELISSGGTPPPIPPRPTR